MSQEVATPPGLVLYRAIKENPGLDRTAVAAILGALGLKRSDINSLARKVISIIGIDYARAFSEDIIDPQFNTAFCATALRCMKVQTALKQGALTTDIEELDEMRPFLDSHSFQTEDTSTVVNKEIFLCVSIFAFPYLEATTTLKIRVSLATLIDRERQFVEATKRLYDYLEKGTVLLEEPLVDMLECMSRQALLVREKKPVYAPTLIEEWEKVQKAAHEEARNIFARLPYTFPFARAHFTLLRPEQKAGHSFHVYVVNETLFSIEKELRIRIPEPFRKNLFQKMMNNDELRREISYFISYPNCLIGRKVNPQRRSYSWLIRFQYYFAFLREYKVPDEPLILEEFLFLLLSAQIQHFELNLKISPNEEALYETQDVLRLGQGKAIDIQNIFSLIEQLTPILVKNGENIQEHSIVFFTIFCRIIYSGITGDTPEEATEELGRLIRFVLRMNKFPLMIISSGHMMTFFEGHLFEKATQYVESLVVDPTDSLAGSAISLVREGSSASLDALGELTFAESISEFNIICVQFRKYTKRESPTHADVVESKENEEDSFAEYDTDALTPRREDIVSFVNPSYLFFEVIQRKYSGGLGAFSTLTERFFHRVCTIAKEDIECERFFGAMKKFLDRKVSTTAFDLISYYLRETETQLGVNEILRLLSQDLPRLPQEPVEDYLEYCIAQVANLTHRYHFDVFYRLNLFIAFVEAGQIQTQIKLSFVDELECFCGFIFPSEKVHDVLFHPWNVNEAAALLEHMKKNFRRPLVDQINMFLLPAELYNALDEFNERMRALKSPHALESIKYKNLEWVETTIRSTCFLSPTLWARSFPSSVMDEHTFNYQNHGSENAFFLVETMPPFTKALKGTWEAGRLEQKFQLSIIRLLPEVYCFSLQTTLFLSLEVIERRPHLLILLKTLAEVVCKDSIRPAAYIEVDSLETLATVYPQIKEFVINPELEGLERPVLDFLKEVKIKIRSCWWNLITQAKLESEKEGEILEQNVLQIVRRGNVYPVTRAPSLPSLPYPLSTEYSLLPLFFRPTNVQQLLFSSLEISQAILSTMSLAIRGGGDRRICDIQFTLSETLQRRMTFPLCVNVNFIGRKYKLVTLSLGRGEFKVNYTVKYPTEFLFELLEDYVKHNHDLLSAHGKGSFQEILETQRKEENEVESDGEEEFMLYPKKAPHPVTNLFLWQFLMLKTEFYQHYTHLRDLEFQEEFDFTLSALKARKNQTVTRAFLPADEILEQEDVFMSLNQDFLRSSDGQTFSIEGHKYVVRGTEGQEFVIQGQEYAIQEGRLIAEKRGRLHAKCILPVSEQGERAEELIFVVEGDELEFDGTEGHDAQALYNLLIQQRVIQGNGSESGSISSLEFRHENRALQAMRDFSQGIFAHIQLEILQTLGIPDLVSMGFAFGAYKEVNPYTTFEMLVLENEIVIKGLHHFVLRYEGDSKTELKKRHDYGVYVVDRKIEVFKQTETYSWEAT